MYIILLFFAFCWSLTGKSSHTKKNCDRFATKIVIPKLQCTKSSYK